MTESTALRWVSCARDVAWSASKTRHLLTPNGIDTVCGCSGLGEGVWRGNHSKPACLRCVELAGEKALNIPPTPQPVRKPAKLNDLDRVKYRFSHRGIDGKYYWESVKPLPGDSRHDCPRADVEWFWASSRKGEQNA